MTLLFFLHLPIYFVVWRLWRVECVRSWGLWLMGWASRSPFED